MWTAERLNHLADTEPHRLVPIVLDLQERLSLHSGNSSKPPSADGYAKPAPKSLRQKSGRLPGGQKRHPGRSLTFVEKPDHVVTHPLYDCPCGCGQSLRQAKVISVERRQVFALPALRLEVTEHQAEVKYCPRSGQIVSAPFPHQVNAPVQYDSNFNALLVYWRDQQLLPYDRISQMCVDLFGQSVSQATVSAAVESVALALAPFEMHITTQIPQATIVHADESGLRVEGKLHWLHVLSTATITWFGVHTKRGQEALKGFGHLAHFTGRLIHDSYSSYFVYPCLHGLCNAHLLRELTFLFEQQQQRWARKMFYLLLAMHRCVERQRARDSPLSSAHITRWNKRYAQRIDQGRLENPPLPPPLRKRRGRVAKTKAQNLLDRLENHSESILAFLSDLAVPFSNNQAEQDLRMLKVQQKISGGFRTLKGAQNFARIRSYLSTARKNNINILSAISNAIQDSPFLPSLSAKC